MEIYIAIALLAVIALSELYRTYLGTKGMNKKAHFKRKLEGTRAMIWDLQFKAFKTREIREDIRKEYDYVQSRMATTNQQIESWPSDGDQAELAKLKDVMVLQQRDSDRFLAQMKHLDLEVEGAKPSAENPEGHEGIMMQIDNLRELASMLGDYIKEL